MTQENADFNHYTQVKITWQKLNDFCPLPTRITFSPQFILEIPSTHLSLAIYMWAWKLPYFPKYVLLINI